MGPRDLAHRLNNLLTVVLAHAESSLANDDPAEMRRALAIIAQTSKEMAAVVHDFAKSSSGASHARRK